METRELDSGGRAAPSGMPAPPRPAWMWKPRSKLVDSDGNKRHTTTLLQLRRLGAKQWNRRFVFLDNHLFCYGKEKGRCDKQIPFELIEAARRETPEKLRREHAPREFADFGWYLAVKGRTLFFCAESEDSAAQWVRYLNALLCVMQGSPTGMAAPFPTTVATAPGSGLAAARGATLAEVGARYDEAHPRDEPHDGTLTLLTSPREPLTEEGEAVPPSAQLSLADTATDARSEPLAAELARGAAEDPGPLTNASLSAGPPLRPHRADAAGDGGHAEESMLDISSADTEGGGSADSSDGDGSDAEAADGSRRRDVPQGTGGGEGGAAVLPAADRPLPREVRYARFLLPLAAEPHSHIGYRLPALESYFRSGDDVSSVVFSRTMEKVGKRDNAQTREVVLTTRHLYLFSKGGMANGQQVRCIDTHDITGVVESTTDTALIAVLIPTFHDVLLKVVPQNSRVPGTPAEVKQQLIAHLYRAHCDVHTDHRFLFRESATVAKEIRRTEDARHPPLRMLAGDQMRAGERAVLLDTFARNADEAVYWSSMVRQVQADRKPRLCALVVTEGSVYALSDTLQEVVRRTPMRDLLHVEYDRDAQSILLQCRGVDTLFNMQSSAEFDGFLSVLPTAVADGYGRSLRVHASKQLYSHAKLFSLSTLGGDGPGGAAHATTRRGRGFLWPKGKKSGGGTRLLSSFAAAAGEEEEGQDEGAAAFHHTLRGDYRNSQAIRRFCAQFRFVEEVLLDYDDVAALRRQHEAAAGQPCWDTLRLRTTLATRARVGSICFSAPCRLLDAKECAALAKPSAHELHDSVVTSMGTTRAVCVTSEGFLFLRHGVAAAAAAAGAAGPLLPPASATPRGSDRLDATPPPPTVREKVKTRLSTAVMSHVGNASSSGGGGGHGDPAAKDDGLILCLVEWSMIAAVVRCHREEGRSVALLTNRTHPADYLFHLDSAETMLDLAAAAVGSYAQYRHGGEDHTHLLPLYAAPRVQSLAVALKKTVFDPFPTIALRYTAYSFPSDRLRMAYVPDVADACRRFGDNTVHFSGVAWRVRSATLRKCNGQLESDPGAEMRRQNNHLYKSFIFVLTNVAVYHCTKGGFEVVRRTLLTDLQGITVGAHDPDTVMLSVPSEYDMYFRIEGRGAEVVARLQEAYVEWTNYGHYLPYEQQGSHTLADYGLPVRHAPCVAALGTLTKPAYFNDLQSSRPAAECRHQTQQWHLRCLRRAIAGFERAQAAARRERSTAGGAPSWGRVRAALAERQSFLYFAQRRCFRFGLTGEEFDEMQRAQRLLRGYREMEASASALVEATASSDPAVFRAALQRASAVPDLRLLVEEERRVYEGYVARRACLAAILSAVRRYRRQPGAEAVSLVALEATLLELFAAARRAGFDPTYLRYVAHIVRVLVQRTQLQRAVSDPALQQRLLAAQGGGWTLIQQAAGEVGMVWRPPPVKLRGNAAREWVLHVAQQALRCAAVSEQPRLLQHALAFADAAVEAWRRRPTVQPAAEESAETAVRALTRTAAVLQTAIAAAATAEHDDFQRRVAALVHARQLHQRQQSWTLGTVAGLTATCARLQAELATRPAPLCQETQSLLALEQGMLAEQRHRLRLRHALEQREVRAQQQHERELQQRTRAAQRAATRRRLREATGQERRQRRALALWTTQVDQLVGALDAVLANADAETDESVRLGIRRCVHLQRWIAEAGPRHGLAADGSSTALSDGAAGPQRGSAALTNLVQRLQSAAARAQELLDRRTSSRDDLRRSSAALEVSAELMCPDPAAPAAAEGGDGSPDAAAAVVLPAEVTALIAALDTEGLVAYIQRHRGNAAAHATPAVLDEIQTQWRQARHRQRWVRELHRRLHAAAVLHSCELLSEALVVADAAAYTDAAVETARRAAAAMRLRRQGASAAAHGAVNGAVPSERGADDSWCEDPWRRSHLPPETAQAVGEEKGGMSVVAVEESTATDAETPPPAAEERLQDDESLPTAAVPPLTAESSTPSAVSPPLCHPGMAKALTAMEGVAAAAETLSDTHQEACRVLQRLYAVTAALVDSATAAPATAPAAAAASGGDAEEAGDKDCDGAAVTITADNPFCGPFLQAWVAVLRHQLRPSGLLIKSPRSAWDLVREVGERNTGGDYAAPYVTRLSRDFGRLYRSTDESEAGRQRTDAVLLALVFFTHRMACVVDGLQRVGEGARRELLLPDAAMAQSVALRAVLEAAELCDGLQWRFANVQALAMECLFPRQETDVPTPQRFLSAAAPSALNAAPSPSGPPSSPSASSMPPPPPRGRVAAEKTALPLAAAAPPSGEPAQHTPPSETVPPCELREARCREALQDLREAVRSVASYFTHQLRTHGPARDGQAAASFLDELCYPEVGTVVDKAVLPALQRIFTEGLRHRHPPAPALTLWDVLTAMRDAVTSSSRTLAAAELLPIMDLVEALTDATDANGRNAGRLRGMTAASVTQLRARMFLRECLNRRQLYALVGTLFPPQRGNGAWVGEGSGLLWTLYDPDLCLLYPPDDAASEQLRPLLEKLAALPFVLFVDRELR